jgi:hypothetical protein
LEISLKPVLYFFCRLHPGLNTDGYFDVFPLKEDFFRKRKGNLKRESLSAEQAGLSFPAADFDEWFDSLGNQKSLQKQLSYLLNYPGK